MTDSIAPPPYRTPATQIASGCPVRHHATRLRAAHRDQLHAGDEVVLRRPPARPPPARLAACHRAYELAQRVDLRALRSCLRVTYCWGGMCRCGGCDCAGTRRALRADMANKAGYALAWLIGIPLPILLIVYLVSRC
jgi:hypothetical protein